jgi:hypothetical protein
MAVEPDKAVDRRGWTEEAELWMRFMRGSGLVGGEAACAKSIDHKMYKYSCFYGYIYISLRLAGESICHMGYMFIPALRPPRASTASRTSGSSIESFVVETTLVPRLLRSSSRSLMSLPFRFIPRSSVPGEEIRLWILRPFCRGRRCSRSQPKGSISRSRSSRSGDNVLAANTGVCGGLAIDEAGGSWILLSAVGRALW